jgi:rhamnosyltransferase subunit B
MARVLVLTRGTEGDVRPFINIGRALLARGHSVVVITHCIFEQLILEAGLGFATFDMLGEYERMLAGFQQARTLDDYIRRFYENQLPKYPVTFACIQEHFRPGETVLLSTANSLMLAWIAREKLKIPIIEIYLAPGLIPKHGMVTQFTPSIDLSISQFRVQMGLPPKHTQPPDVVAIALWPDWYAAFKPEGTSQALYGGFPLASNPNEALPVEVEALLATAPAPIFLTGGSGVFVSEQYYSACIEACRRLGRRVILVARRQAGLPRTLPPDVHVFPFLPFSSLMPRVAAVIHHGGIGTAALAFAAGVPQVILANGIDRPGNAMRVERLGVGKFVPPRRWDADGVAAALTSLVDNPPVLARCQELAHRIREDNSLTRVVDTIEKMAHHG